MRQKEFTKSEVKTKIKDIKKAWKEYDLDGATFSLKDFLGDYTNNSMLRHIKEVLFANTTPNGRTWYFKYPKKSSKKLAKKVMKTTYATKNINYF
jgi:hypothetical protein